MNTFLTQKPEDVISHMNSRLGGLSDSEIISNREKYGKNLLPGKNKTPAIIIFFSQFKSLLVIILLVTGVVSILLNELNDAIAIWLILVINAFIGFWQEYKAEITLESLKQYETSTTKVIRQGRLVEIDSQEIVVGDIVEFVNGDKISADVRIIESSHLEIDESLLTGESENIEKNNEPLQEDATQLHAMTNIAFKGSNVVNGRMKGIVIHVGSNTQLGKIAKNLSHDEKDETNLQRKLRELGIIFAFIGIGLMIVLGIIGYAKGNELKYVFLLSVSIGVSAIPEGLPVITTVALALGVQRMAKKLALIRKLPAVEALSSVEIICVDKTGTLTQNNMVTSSLFTANEDNQNELELLKRISAFCSDASLESGNQTERALNRYFFDSDESLNQYRSNFKRMEEITFSSINKYMATFGMVNDEYFIYVKGAFDRLKNKFKFIYQNGQETVITEDLLNEFIKKEHEYAQNGFRVIAMGYQKSSNNTAISNETLDNLVLVGLAAISDPPRTDVKDAIAKTHDAGIRIIMITGDQKLTAQYIAKEVGLIQNDDNEAIAGNELEKMNDDQLSEALENTSVFYRIEPMQKLKILEVLQKKNYQVAMTGDGVNDALALKKANIGLVMNSGTDISKDVSDVVLLNNNFSPIPQAIEEGRKIFTNIRKFLILLLTTNFGEVAVVAFNLVTGFPIPFQPIHILWLNLVSDGLPAVALANDKAGENLMKKTPDRFKSLFKGIWKLFTIGAFIDLAVTGSIFIIAYYVLERELVHAQTMVVLGTTITELGMTLSIRSKAFDFKSMLNNNFLNGILLITFLLQVIVVSTPVTQHILQLRPLSYIDWFYVLSIPLGLFILMELYKLVVIGRK